MPDIRGHHIAEGQKAVGYGWLVERFDLQAPLRRLSVVSTGSVKGNRRTEGAVTIHDKRDWADSRSYDRAVEHLDFALRHEPIDLLLLKKAMEKIGPAELTSFVQEKRFSAAQRRIWFFYEWLTGRKLPIEDLDPTTYIDALDPETYYVLGEGKPSKRHRVRDNLPGTAEFCPIARRGTAADEAADLSMEAGRVVKGAAEDIVRRAAAFLTVSDSKSSFEIEGESPPQDRIQRWARAIGRAGQQPLSLDLICSLQKDIVDQSQNRIDLGLRKAGVWLGDRDRDGYPVPEFIGARPEDLEALMAGLVAHDRLLAADRGFNPIVHAAGLGFGFVYVHPLQDGNGRLHRYLINHALAEDGFSPKGVVLPVSKEILSNIVEYGAMLRGRSGPLLDHISWRVDERRNVVVVNDTADLYRYPDVTEECAFLAKCLKATIEHDLPKEIEFLGAYDRAIRDVSAVVDLPNQRMSLLVIQTLNNKGSVPKRRLKGGEYGQLTEDEVERIETAVRDAFGLDPEPVAPTP